jgi:excisionase family DNA binding protein
MNKNILEKLNSIESKLNDLLSAKDNSLNELTTSEAATFLGISYSSVRNLIAANTIPYRSRQGTERKHIRFTLLDLQKYKDSTMTI